MIVVMIVGVPVVRRIVIAGSACGDALVPLTGRGRTCDGRDVTNFVIL